MTTITKSGSKLTVEAMKYTGKSIAKKIFDLNNHKGERTRVHIGTDDKFTIAIKPRQNLLVCELDIPERKYVHIESVVNGETIVESSEKELKLGEVTMIEYLKKGVTKI